MTLDRIGSFLEVKSQSIILVSNLLCLPFLRCYFVYFYELLKFVNWSRTNEKCCKLQISMSDSHKSFASVHNFIMIKSRVRDF